MKFRQGLIAVLLTAGLSSQAFAQVDEFEVTLEVLDDISDIDAVVLRLENEERRDVEVREQREEERARDFAVDERVRRETESVERDSGRELDERRDFDLEEREVEREFERQRELDEEPVDERPVERAERDQLERD